MSETQVVPTETIDDYERISEVVQLYIDGSAKGDAGKLRKAFVESAWMYGAVGEQRFDVPIEKLFEMVDKQAADVDGRYRARITSVQQVGDAAVATVAEDGCWGRVAFVDFFLLARIGGAWKIVSKLFAHTGGDMPN